MAVDSLADISFTAFRAIEENPYREVLAEVLKAVFDFGGDEQNVVRSKCLAHSAANKLAGALRHDVDFIARVRSLRIAPARRIELYHQRTVFEERHRALALGTGQACECVLQLQLLTVTVAHGDAGHNTLQ